MFLINLIPLHVLALMITGRFSHRIYVAYSTVSIMLGSNTISKLFHWNDGQMITSSEKIFYCSVGFQ